MRNEIYNYKCTKCGEEYEGTKKENPILGYENIFDKDKDFMLLDVCCDGHMCGCYGIPVPIGTNCKCGGKVVELSRNT